MGELIEELEPGNGHDCEVCMTGDLGDDRREAVAVVHAVTNDFYVCAKHLPLVRKLAEGPWTQ